MRLVIDAGDICSFLNFKIASHFKVDSRNSGFRYVTLDYNMFSKLVALGAMHVKMLQLARSDQ